MHGGHDFLDPFLGVFGLRAVCLYDAMSSEVHIAGSAGRYLEEKTGQVFIRARDLEDPDLGFREGAFVSAAAPSARLASRASNIRIDRWPARGPRRRPAGEELTRLSKASRAAAAAQTESYRTAILDALAHEFKTPLSTILAAAGSLREGGSSGPHHREMAETVESEAARLGRLTSRLLRTARLEREAVKPWIELIDVSSVIADTVEQYQRQSVDHRFPSSRIATLAKPSPIRNCCGSRSASFWITPASTRCPGPSSPCKFNARTVDYAARDQPREPGSVERARQDLRPLLSGDGRAPYAWLRAWVVRRSQNRRSARRRSSLDHESAAAEGDYVSPDFADPRK